MKSELLHKWAENNDGKIINIKNVLITEEYYCPDCKEKFIFRKGKIRQQHFAHNSFSPSCTGEGYLHKTFKKILLQEISNCINNKMAMHIINSYKCCSAQLIVNLLTKNCEVKDEYNMGKCRPDIALLEEDGTVYAVFEIVVTHKPEDNVLNYYKEKNIIVIQIELNSESNLDNINEIFNKHSKIIVKPDYLEACINKNCITKRIGRNRRLSRNSRIF